LEFGGEVGANVWRVCAHEDAYSGWLGRGEGFWN